MPEKKTIQRAHRDKAKGKAPTTQAGEFVHEEFEHVKGGKHGVKSRKQAIAIGLNKARRAGVRLGGPKRRSSSAKKRSAASTKRASAKRPARTTHKPRTTRRSRPAKKSARTQRSHARR